MYVFLSIAERISSPVHKGSSGEMHWHNQDSKIKMTVPRTSPSTEDSLPYAQPTCTHVRAM